MNGKSINNYEYDKPGNLTDNGNDTKSENSMHINWMICSKIANIQKQAGSVANYVYHTLATALLKK